MGQDQGHRAHLFQGAEHHLRVAVGGGGDADVDAGVGEDHEPQLAGPVQDAQIADIVEPGGLIGGVELDALQTQGGDPSQLSPGVRTVRVDAAEGVDAGPAAPGVDLSGALVDMGHLMGVGGHRQDYGAVDARPGHGGGQAGVGGVGEGPGMTGTLELADGGGRKLVREGVGVDINDHGGPSFPGK